MGRESTIRNDGAGARTRSTVRRPGSLPQTPGGTASQTASVVDLAPFRRRATGTVFGSVALATTGLFAALTVAPIVADEVMGMRALSGFPGAASIAGTALGATLLSRVMARRGRRPGHVLGFAVAGAGAAVAAVAVLQGVFVLFLLGMMAIGVGNSGALLGRYTAADVHPAERRTSVIGWVAWAATIGAVVGPALVDPSAAAIADRGLPALSGPLLVAVVGFVLAAGLSSLLLRPDPSTLSFDLPDPAVVETTGRIRGVWRPPRIQVALASLVAGQFVMVLIMTMTPVHMRHAGHSLGAVSLVMSSHVLGMYALTPVAGWLADRVGHLRTIAAGLAMLALSGVVAAAAPAGNQYALAGSLFLLGLGWSFGFVSASGLLTRGSSFSERARLQGSADTFVFASATVASLGSGFLIATIGYLALCLLGTGLVLLPAAVVLRHRRAVRLDLVAA